jgi:hypothetical protein
MRPPTPLHNLRGNAAERSPRHVAILDTETRWRETNDGEMHTLRLWAARFLHRGHDHPRLGVDHRAWGESVGDLVDTLAEWVRHADSLWLYIHRTAFDLSVTRLPMRLVEAGWELGDHGLTMDKPWFRARLGDNVLTVVDSSSLLSASLEKIGVLIGMPKLPLPDNADTQRDWLARCERDVDVLAAAMVQVMDWWDEHGLGCWSLTGAATGWNAYRHNRTGPPILIDPSPEARAFERRAITGGRRDVWRVGQLARSRYLEIDFERAHLTVCRHLPLPYRRRFAFGTAAVPDGQETLPGTGAPAQPGNAEWNDRDWLDPERFGAVADVTVRTEKPRYPAHIDGRWWYPTGEFRTTLAWPELIDARDRGELVAMHGGWTHALHPHMAEWAQWIADVLDADPGTVPPMAQLAAKGWSRSVPGKWATRTSRKVDERPSHIMQWAVEHGMAHPDDVPLTILHLMGTQTWYYGDQEGDDSFPAVLAYIQSHVRLRLNRLVDLLPAGSVVSCNTDGVIVKATRTPDLERLAAATWPLVPRVKAKYHSVQVLGPNHLICDGEARLSGVPLSADLVENLTWEWHTWPGLGRQVEIAPGDGYLRQRRRVRLDAVPVTRWVLADGRTVPPRAFTTVVAGSQLLPWHLTPSELRYQALRRPQHPTLERAMADYGDIDALAPALAAGAA